MNFFSPIFQIALSLFIDNNYVHVRQHSARKRQTARRIALTGMRGYLISDRAAKRAM